MKVLALSFIIVLATALVCTAAAQDGEGEGGVAHVRVRRGFGCPLNQRGCHLHCRSIGRRGGYCAGVIRQTCTCYHR
ncbi:defensin-like [Dermacentor andersoni]|uniref:defensin-like n=1 Tax=Dermacentor andersoni TaxID=34620 RepID=UPI002155753C|nr:defensin-like [Dermacentor andersoni]